MIQQVTEKQIIKEQDKFFDAIDQAIDFLKTNGMTWEGLRDNLYDSIDRAIEIQKEEWEN